MTRMMRRRVIAGGFLPADSIAA